MVWVIFKIHPCLLPYSSWIWMFALEYRWVWWALIFLLVIWILLAVFRRFSRNILWTLCGFMSISRYLFALQIQSMLLVVTWKKKCSTKIVRSLNNHHLDIYSMCVCAILLQWNCQVRLYLRIWMRYVDRTTTALECHVCSALIHSLCFKKHCWYLWCGYYIFLIRPTNCEKTPTRLNT